MKADLTQVKSVHLVTQVKSVHLDEVDDELKSGHWWSWFCTVEMMDGTTRTGTIESDEHNHDMETLELDDEDPTLWCNACGAATSKQCHCPPISKDD